MRRGIITWSVVAAVLLATFGVTILALNSTLYSASGFVRSYLEALARHDASGALELAGPIPAGDASAELLTAEAMGELSDITFIGETTDGGAHRVRFSFEAGGVAGESSFAVVRSGTFLGIFDRWQFETTPFGVVDLTVRHDTRFEVEGIELQTPSQDRAAPYLVFAPGSYTFSQKTAWLEASPVKVTVADSENAVAARLSAESNDALRNEVERQLTAYIDRCAAQTALLPAGCPFGQSISNRITTAPVWSIVQYPEVRVVPGSTPGEWIMPASAGTARVVVDVQSLFDGSISTLDAEVPFALGYSIQMLPSDELALAPKY